METNILLETRTPEHGYTRMALCRKGTDEYIVRGLRLDGTWESIDRIGILSRAYQILNACHTEQAGEVAEFLRDGATEAEWILAALTVL